MKLFLSLLIIYFLVGCHKSPVVKSVVWEARQGAPPEVPQGFDAKVIQVRTKEETIERFSQQIEGAEIENSFLQWVRRQDPSPIYMNLQYVEGISSASRERIKTLMSRKDLFLAQAQRNFSELKEALLIRPVKVIFSPKPRAFAPQVYYQVDFISKDGTGAQRWQMESGAKVLRRSQVSSYYDGQAMAFPRGPQLSQMEEVLLPSLVENGSLKNSRVSVITQSNAVATSTGKSFFFKPDDPRFDQVQVFYYAHQMIQLFQSRLGVELPFAIELKTHIGFPAKKTVMFYFDRRIHLGQGDEVYYKDVLKDPTIVMHETAHAFVEALSGLPQGALNEAFADFFTTSFLDHPHLGEVSCIPGPYTRSVENSLSFLDQKGSVYGDSLIVSGLFWRIRKDLGASKAESLAVKTLTRLGPAGSFRDLGPTIQSLVASDLKADDAAKVMVALEERGFPLPEAR